MQGDGWNMQGKPAVGFYKVPGLGVKSDELYFGMGVFSDELGAFSDRSCLYYGISGKIKAD